MTDEMRPDIVQRLRARQSMRTWSGTGAPIKQTIATDSLCQNAADEIERLRSAVAAARAEERERCAKRLEEAMALEGFGCACEPKLRCGTCKARDTLSKALKPLLLELRADAIRKG